MDSVSVNRDDIDALAQALEDGALAAKDLLSSLVAAIREVSGDEESVTVTVEVVGSLQETFDAAFTPEPEPAPGHQIHVRVHKITR
jgi:hypothetical protein